MKSILQGDQSASTIRTPATTQRDMQQLCLLPVESCRIVTRVRGSRTYKKKLIESLFTQSFNWQQS